MSAHLMQQLLLVCMLTRLWQWSTWTTMVHVFHWSSGVQATCTEPNLIVSSKATVLTLWLPGRFITPLFIKSDSIRSKMVDFIQHVPMGLNSSGFWNLTHVRHPPQQKKYTVIVKTISGTCTHLVAFKSDHREKTICTPLRWGGAIWQ